MAGTIVSRSGWPVVDKTYTAKVGSRSVAAGLGLRVSVPDIIPVETVALAAGEFAAAAGVEILLVSWGPVQMMA